MVTTDLAALVAAVERANQTCADCFPVWWTEKDRALLHEAATLMRRIGPADGEWKSIESAPEDTDVLGYFPDAWHKVRRFRKFTREGGIVWTIETQSFSDPGSRMTHDKLPTHWQPLPPPPELCQ